MSDSAQAVPPPPAPQPVTVTNTPDVVVVDPVEVTGVGGGAVPVACTEPIPWSVSVADAFVLSVRQHQWCTGISLDPIPAGYRFVIDTVNARVQVAPGQNAEVWVSAIYDSVDGEHGDAYVMRSQSIPDWNDFGLDQWIVNESVSLPAHLVACFMVEVDPTPAGEAPSHGNVRFTLGGHLLPL